MKLFTYGATAAVVAASAVALSAQRPGVDVDKDDITIRGCVTRAERYNPVDKMPLVWSRNDVLVSLSEGWDRDRRTADKVNGRLFYWLEDEDLSDHVGQMVEIKGDLEDLERGQFEIDRKKDFTTLELKFDGKSEKAKLPTPWFAAPNSKDEREYDVVVQKVDVDDVKVLGACNR
jgi:hypothetical protein